MLTIGSICSGIGGAELAFHGLAESIFAAEIESFPCAVLKHRFPALHNIGDMLTLIDNPVPVDILVGGSPCQAFSTAGKRLSLNDARGNLALALVMVLDAIDEANRLLGLPPCTLLWENVPGVLNTDDNAFGCFLSALVGEEDIFEPPAEDKRFWRSSKKYSGLPVPKWPVSGHIVGPKRSLCWRVLDAQYFGLAQRRKRVFLVASARDGFDPREVLLERKGLQRDPAPSGETRQDITGTIAARARGGGGLGTDFDCDGGLVVAFQSSQSGMRLADTHGTLDANNGSRRHNGVIVAPKCYRLYTANDDVIEAAKEVDKVATISGRCEAVGNSGTHLIAYGGNNTSGPINVATARNAGKSPHGRLDFETETFLVQCVTGDKTHALNTANNGKGSSEDGTGRSVPVIAFNWQTGGDNRLSPLKDQANTLQRDKTRAVLCSASVRRLTPLECERLQGLPDYWNDIPWHGKNHAPDGPRYRAIGNGFAVNVVRWIAKRLIAELHNSSEMYVAK